VTDAAGTSEGRWTLGGSGIVLRIGKETREGHIDSEGNFILTVVGQPVMLKKVQ
jgi:hypothetical protein